MKNLWWLALTLVACTSAQNTVVNERPSISLCPENMVKVSEKLCVDRWEYPNKKDVQPEGFKARLGCESACASVGKRLLTRQEWKIVCQDTPQDKCNVNSYHPVEAALKNPQAWIYRGRNCKQEPWSSTCMNDPSLVGSWLWKNEVSECVSSSGVFNMIGNLGEWVSDTLPNGHGVFMGGLAPQPKSSCEYVTTAHDPSWSDYSIGCRCTKDL